MLSNKRFDIGMGNYPVWLGRWMWRNGCYRQRSKLKVMALGSRRDPEDVRDSASG